ncbi:putative GTP-binding protein 6 [Hermetia illucens]|uniref:putative GTP-binding protein 6 n=1 Tax=Hermetia illucens TaxID=343691 RepID=UPI0018CC57EE|nr:putative GTP-binding protein 6 [Hermetia illucens]
MSILRVVARLGSNIRRINKVKGIEICGSYTVISARWKHTQYTGVKGLRSRKSFFESNTKPTDGDEEGAEEELDLENSQYDLIANTTMHVTRQTQVEQSVLVIQPYIKWGPKKSATDPDLQLQEAIALVNSLPNWSVEESLKVPLESLGKKALFGSGKLQELKDLVRKIRSSGRKLTSIFISKGTLSFAQKQFLEYEFGLPVMDRYSVVIQILRLHATSAEAKLQVAMAEIPYIWTQVKDASVSTNRRQGYALSDLQKEILRTRESKLKSELMRVRSHRKLLRNKRKQKDYPTVAVVGYTNAGKTSLIKALTDEQTIQPRDQLFATLDVTAHAGVLPCNLEVIFMDTVGFMSDIPTGLIECFVATLEDAMMADVIVHVQDVSHPNHLQQKLHVEDTIKSLARNPQMEEAGPIDSPRIINVGNKVDLLTSNLSSAQFDDLTLVSSKTLVGINQLMLEIEEKVLEVTGRIKMRFSVPSGGEEMAWLYKNAAIVDVVGNPEKTQFSIMSAIITNSKLEQFKHRFMKRR